MRKILWFLMAIPIAIITLHHPAAAQEIVTPTIVVAKEEKAEPLKLSAVKIDITVLGYMAETKMTMTFYNPNSRVLAGDLYFPLPEGATVSGYALDVGGVMVDGVVVEKDKGRRVYEKIVRQGIDPGLVEQVKGNNFKTRIFPIFPRGTRTVMVRYISELVQDPKGTSYHLPLNFKDPVADFSLRMEVMKAAAKPVIKQSELSNFEFSKWRDSYVAETALKMQAGAKDLIVALPEVERERVLVEKGDDGQYYFVINDFPTLPSGQTIKRDMKSPSRIVVFWDASGSRGKTDHSRELELLKKYFAKHGSGKIDVDLVVFRNEAEKAERFVIENGNADKLIAALSEVDYDGGTQMGALSHDKDAAPPDFYLLFSDGISNFGKDEPSGFKAPIYAFSADSTSNHAFLKHLALQTGGSYFNLSRLDDDAILSGIGVAPYSFISATADGSGIEEIYPKTSQPVHGKFSVAGKLTGDKAKITLNYGVNGKTVGKAEYEISRADAAHGGLLRLFWAQKKIEDLEIFLKRNEKALVATGKEYGIVTPGTSLIVLESLPQYVEHEVAPPKSLPDMRAAYFAAIESRQRKEQTRVENKLDRVLAMWQKRVDWWNTEFKQGQEPKLKLGVEESPQTTRSQATRDSGFVQGALETVQGLYRRVESKAKKERDGVSRAPQAAPSSVARQSESASDLRKERRAGMVANDAPAAPQVEGAAANAPLEFEGQASEPKQAVDKMAAVGAEKPDQAPTSAAGSISIKEWDPATPYLTRLKEASPQNYVKDYMGLRKDYSDSPSFFLDCADFFFKQKQDELAVRVLSNIAELELENPKLLRVLGYRLAQANLMEPAKLVFEEVLKLRPEEPQSYRDLALVLDSMGEYDRAVELLYQVVTTNWDRFPEIEVVVLMELNRTIARAKRAGATDFPVDPRVIKLLDVDVRIVLTWDADMTDLDLWVNEPSGQKAYYQNKLTPIGGLVSRDVTDGYGPEEYVLKKAPKGRYKAQANYYGSRAPNLTGAVTMQVDVFTNYGRADEKRRSITLRLNQRQEVVDIGELDFQ